MSFLDVVKGIHRDNATKKAIKEEQSLFWETGGDVVSEPLKTALGSGFFRKDEEPRADGLHPSQLFGMCMRGKILSEAIVMVAKAHPEFGIRFKPEKISASLQAKFDIGHAVHHWYQNRYLGPMGILKGGWRCRQCGDTKTGYMPADVCSCGVRSWGFQEPKVLIPELGITGHCDGIIDHGDGDWVMDIKTIDPERFRTLSEPSRSYVYQVHCYMMGLGINRAIILYVDKSANMANPTKEIKIKFDPKVEGEIKAIGKQYMDCYASRTIPDVACPPAACKKCPCADVCKNKEQVRDVELFWSKV